ncbi:MAG: hypothetical protein GX600_03015 [Dehalococcoidia bacterium]|nr:hypothetical protein [Dehalococcoidia bacterium]
MNCSVCGGPLLFDRVVFRCECGAYVHAYCVDKHIVDSHRPDMEEGYADLNGEFHLKHQPANAAVVSMSPIAEPPTGKVEEDDEVDDDLVAAEELVVEEVEPEGGDEEPEEDS